MTTAILLMIHCDRKTFIPGLFNQSVRTNVSGRVGPDNIIIRKPRIKPPRGLINAQTVLGLDRLVLNFSP